MEEERRRENMEKLRKDMENSKGETVVLSTGLKDKEALNETMMNEEGEEEEEEEEPLEFYSEEEDVINEDEDEEVARFSF